MTVFFYMQDLVRLRMGLQTDALEIAPGCVARMGNGTPCQRPATIFDPQRRGMVCDQHGLDDGSLMNRDEVL